MRAIQCAGWTTVFFVRVRGVVRIMSVASIISLVLWGGDATAFMDVVCKNQSCLSSGWVAYGEDGRLLGETECLGDCALEGWRIFSVGSNSTEVRCKPRGCFVGGWMEVDNYGRVLVDVACRTSMDGVKNCLVSGWHGSSVNGPVSARCRLNDCRGKGWDFQSINQSIVCKGGDCFTYGWKIYP